MTKFSKGITVLVDIFRSSVEFFKQYGSNMAKIKVKQLEIGMTITADVCDPNGRFLLGKGCVLEEKHLKALHAWGVINVEINGDEMPDDSLITDLSPEVYNALEEQVSSRFIHNDMSHPFIKELSNESIRFFAERLKE